MTNQKSERNKEIIALHKEGVSYNKLAKAYDLSPQRCCQIYNISVKRANKTNNLMGALDRMQVLAFQFSENDEISMQLSKDYELLADFIRNK